MRVYKQGRVVDIPVTSKAIVKLREHVTGKVTSTKAIVMKATKPDDFSRAYGKQVLICTMFGKGRHREVYSSETGAGDLYPVGRAKRIPAVCRRALREYESK